MAYRSWSTQDYPFHVPISPEDCYDYQTYDGLVESSNYNLDHEPRNGQVHSMRRYLDELDRPLFAVYSSDMESAFVPTWSGHPLPPLEYVDSHCTPFDHHQRMTSPSSNSVSGSSSYMSSNLGEAPEVSSWSSPEMAMVDYIPGVVCSAYGYNHSQRIKREDSLPGSYGSCVALHEVQTHADAIPDDSVGLDDDGITYTGYLGYMDAEEGYQPLETTGDRRDVEHNIMVYQSPPETIKSEDSSPPGSPEVSSPSQCRDTSTSPNIRRRRAPSAITSSANNGSNRVNKRRSVASKYVDEPTTSRAFPCSLAGYGCPSTFGSKNEWKRHINTQHMRLDFWRCDQCPPTRSASSRGESAGKNNVPANHANKRYNDFNRKDLFIQHVRRMHPNSILPNLPSSDLTAKPTSKSGKPTGSSRSTTTNAQQAAQNARAQDAALMQIAARCRRRTRSPPPESGCLFCPARFRGEDTWDERLEHIGRHFECMRKSSGNTISSSRDEEDDEQADDEDTTDGTDPGRWRRDALVEEWMLKEGILVRAGGRGRGCILAT